MEKEIIKTDFGLEVHLDNKLKKTNLGRYGDASINVDDITGISDVGYTDIAINSKETYICHNFIIKLKTGLKIVVFIPAEETPFSIFTQTIESITDYKFMVYHYNLNKLKISNKKLKIYTKH